jgi:glycosyltransferase involved in cell wall biosynthesis
VAVNNDKPFPAAGDFLADRAVDPVRPQKGTSVVRADAKLARHPRLCARPQVSVVLGSLNRLALLQAAIASVRRELSNLSGEILVVDGGSMDGSIEWLVQQADIITIVQRNRAEVNGVAMRRRSWGSFMNMAFRSAAADLVLMISDDCLLLPGSISAAVTRIEAARKAGLRVGACAFYFRNWPDEQRYYVQRTLGGNLMVNHGVYVREALEAVGYADEDQYVFYKADTDLSLKIWEAGFQIIDSPQSICEHYLDPAEAARISNNELMDFDRGVMRHCWPALVSKPSVAKMGKAYLDTTPSEEALSTWGPLVRASVAGA